jgi:cytoskeletal protein RodZ
MGELGNLLRSAREAKGLSFAQVEEATKIRSAYLQALEEEAFDRLPAPVYVRGFLKNYALFLGLDAQQVLSQYTSQEPPAATVDIPAILDEPLQPVGLRRFRLIWLALLAVALVVAGWWVYQNYGDQLPFLRPAATPTPTPIPTLTLAPTPLALTATPPSTVAASPTRTSAPSPSPTPTRTPTQVVILDLRVDVVNQRAWLLVEADGQPVFAGILEPGATTSWTARERIFLRCGNAGAVRVTVNGQDMGLLGDIGQVLDREWTVPGVPTSTPRPTATP